MLRLYRILYEEEEGKKEPTAREEMLKNRERRMTMTLSYVRMRALPHWRRSARCFRRSTTTALARRKHKIYKT